MATTRYCGILADQRAVLVLILLRSKLHLALALENTVFRAVAIAQNSRAIHWAEGPVSYGMGLLSPLQAGKLFAPTVNGMESHRQFLGSHCVEWK